MSFLRCERRGRRRSEDGPSRWGMAERHSGEKRWEEVVSRGAGRSVLYEEYWWVDSLVL